MTDWKRLFAYDAWANRETLASLRAAGDGSPERARRRLAHVIGAQRLWLARIESGAGSPPEVWPDLTLDEIAAEIGELGARWSLLVTGLDEIELARTVTYVNSKGEPWSSSVRDVLLQLILHGGQHRGQIASDLRDAGFTPPYTDYIEAIRRHWI
jgi:uncharacterized damage-inducible protein DinB